MKKNEKDAFNQMEPGLRTALGFDVGLDEKSVPDELPDAIGDLAFESQWKFPRPKADGGNAAPEKKPLSRAEIATALQNLSKTLGRPGFSSTAQLIQKLAVAAREHLEPDNPVRSWLIAYAEGDQQSMRASIKTLVAKSRTEIVEYARRSQDVSMQRGTPNAVVKKNGWTYKYDSAGSLQACFEGDTEPFIFAN